MVPNQRPNPAGQPGGNGFELGLVAVLGAVMIVVGVVYAARGSLRRSPADRFVAVSTELLPVVGRLAQHPGDPAAAWGDSRHRPAQPDDLLGVHHRSCSPPRSAW